MDITIKASDGELFNGTNFEALKKEVNVYEANLELKRLEQEEKRKKAEENRYNQVLDRVDYLNKAIKYYEEETGEKLYFIGVNEGTDFSGFRSAVGTNQEAKSYLEDLICRKYVRKY